CDGADNDCDPTTVFAGEDADADADGAVSCDDCDDGNPGNFPGNPEVCDGLDNDCDVATVFTGEDLDGDADGAIACLDCDDGDAANYPGNPEICDDGDNDCDGVIDLTGGFVDSAPGSQVGPAAATVTTDTITVPLGGSIEDVDVLLDLSHTWNADLDVFVISPQGTVVELFTDQGDSGDDVDAEFDDESLNTLPGETTPSTLSGDYAPEGLLSGFDGEEAAGVWTLQVTDDGAGEQGTLNSWALEFNLSEPGSTSVCAALSCADILAVDAAAPDASYWIDGYSTGTASQFVCDMSGGGWTQVFSNDFDASGPAPGWSSSATYSCASNVMLGGYGNIAGGTLEITLDTSAIEHTEARIATRYHAVDSWDNETGWIDIDGVNLWAATFNLNSGSNVCGGGWKDRSTYIDQSVTHTATTLFYSAGSNLNQGDTDESFGVDDVEVWIR
ncbi:MAG: proprotein convertase P-domain-containing protein, partial [Deltaproteobacteria bacterium]|nr:proprotein convertase P-domain-containing protein [Deltaproteobacteria bacterium]